MPDAWRSSARTSISTALLRELIAMFQHRCEEKQLGLRLEAPDHAMLVNGDEGKLRQVLINLLGNAVKFTERERVVLRANQGEDDAWRFEVEDTGIGISEAMQQRIFEPFQQGHEARSEGGTGLGLAIAKRQADIVGGELGVKSELGTGSMFPSEASIACRDAEQGQCRLARDRASREGSSRSCPCR